MAVAFPPSPLDTSGNAAVNGSASLGPTSADAAVTNAPHSPHPSPADQLAALSPYSYSSCQAAATDAWRADLRSLFEKSGDRFADVSWTTSARQEHGTEEGEEGGRAPSPGAEDTIWAHKAILYARAPNTFQVRYLHLRSPAENLGQLANNSTVSLPSIRSSAPSPDFSLAARNEAGRPRKSVRGAAPPSSYPLSHNHSPKAGSTSSTPKMLRRTVSRSSLSPSVASGATGSTRSGASLSRRASTSSSRASDVSSVSGMSVASAVSTVRPAMTLSGISQAFFSSILEYLYTAEESMVEAFEFLYEDRVGVGGGMEERLEKLRQDLVFMWRSKLYSDVKITLAGGAPAPRNIPDPSASVASLSAPEDDEEEGGEVTSFSTHRMMLVSRSPYFAAQLLSPYADAHATVLSLPSPPFSPASVHFTLGFLYTGTLAFSNRTFDLTTAFQLWRAGAYLQIESLQALASASITHEFCHGFTCACKTCLKRVPRALAFASAPDVSDVHLSAAARGAVSGANFGSFWAREVGMLDYASRGALVSDVCARLEPGNVVSTLRQLLIVGTRLDTERASRWVDALRWMCESVEARVRELLEPEYEKLVESKEWTDLLEGVGFNNDVLEKALVMLVDSLNEQRAAKIYEILVGQVLLREAGLGPGDARQMVEDARAGVLRYLRRRWVGVRVNAGFDSLENWALKELSDELDVPVDDLLLGKDERVGAGQEAPRSRTGLRAARTVSKESATSGRGEAAKVPKTSQDEERASGPINMRAAVLNRNAARTSAVHGFRGSSAAGAAATGSSTASVGQANGNTQGTSAPGSIMARRRGSAVSTATTVSAASSRARTISTSRSNVTRPRQNAPSTHSIRSVSTVSTTTSARSRPAAPVATRAATRPESTHSVRSTASTRPTATVSIPERRASADAAAAPTSAPAPGSATSSRTTSPVKRSATTPEAIKTPTASITSVHSDSEKADPLRTPTASRILPSGTGTLSTAAGTTPATNSAPVRTPRTPTASVHSVRSTTSSASSLRAPPTRVPPTTSAASLTTPKATKRTAPSTLARGSSNATPNSTNGRPEPAKRPFLKATPRPDPITSPTSSGRRPSASSTTAAARSTPRTPTTPGGTGSTSRPASRTPSRANSAGASSVRSTKSVRRVQPPLPSADKGNGTETTKSRSTASTPARGRSPVPALPEPLPLPKDAAPNAKEFNEAVENSLPSPRATPEPEPTRSAAAAAPQDATTTMEGEHAGVPAPAELVTQKAAAEQSSPVSVDRDANAMDVDEPSPTAPAPASQAATPESSIPFDVSTHGTQLTLGIPCIVAPRNVRTQKPLARFRATVKYIGPLAGHTGAWVGVEVPLPLPAALEGESSNDGTLGIGAGGWNDGTWAGVRYFLLGPPRGERSGEAGRERRRRIARMVGKSETEIESEWDDADPRGLDADGPAPAKRRKDASGVKYGAVRSTLTGKDGEQAGKAEQSETRGLFIRPSDVLWVVSSD